MSQAYLPQGWYPDPDGTDAERWWDGGAWTETVRGGTPPAVPEQTPADKRRGSTAREPVYHRRGSSPPRAASATVTPKASETPAQQRARQRFERLYSAMPERERSVALANPPAYWSAQLGGWSLLFPVFVVPSVIAIILAVRGLALAEALGAEGKAVTGYGRAGFGLGAGVVGVLAGSFVALIFVGAFFANT